MSGIDGLAIPHALGGSLAASFFGEPWATADVDVAIRIDEDLGEALLERVRPEFYVPLESAREAIRYRRGGSVSDRQWRDVVGILLVRGSALDIDYLQKTAHPLDLSDLLQRALLDADPSA